MTRVHMYIILYIYIYIYILYICHTYIYLCFVIIKEYTYTHTHAHIHKSFFFQINISQVSDGTTYTGSIICPSCLEICYVRMYIHFIPNK